jgi:thiol-disulfide isomerase/thioredoxin
MLSSLAGLFKKQEQNQQFDESSNLSVRSPDEVPKLEKLIRGGPITYVFVHADWCGHCQTYKPIWQSLLDIPGRKVSMGMIHHDMVERSALLKDAKIPGFPTVLKVFSNGHIEQYKGEDNKQTNAVPKMRDLEAMRNEIMTASRQLPTSPNSSSSKDSTKESDQKESDQKESDKKESDKKESDKKESEEEEEELNENAEIPNNNNRKVVQLKPRNKDVKTVKKVKAQPPKKASTIMPTITYSPMSSSVTAVSRNTKRNLTNEGVRVTNEPAPVQKNSITVGASPAPPMKGGSLFHALTHALTQTAPTALLLLANASLVKRQQLPPKKSSGSTMRLTRNSRSSRSSRKSSKSKSRKN